MKVKIWQILILLCFLNFLLPFCSVAEDELPSALPKTKDLNTKEDDQDKIAPEEEKEETIDPSSIFKLVAVYLIDNQPRALIKNLTKVEEPAREFQVGDSLDDEQIYTLSKITFNPTTRIEIIDKSGLNYLVKQSHIDEKSGQGTASTLGSTTTRKSLPGKYTSSGAKKAPKKTPTKIKEAEKAVETKGQEKKEEVKETIEAQIKKEETISPALPPLEAPKQATTDVQAQGQQPSQTVTIGGGQTAEKTEKKSAPAASAPTPRSSDVLDVSRPADAFGNR